MAVNYKQHLKNVSELKSSGISCLHQRVKILVKVFDDATFREDIGGDDFALASALNKYVDDCALSFLELRTVLQTFPNEADWIKTSLRQLLENALKAGRSSKDNDKEPVARRTVTIKEFDALGDKLKDAEYMRKTLGDEVSELRAENRRLLAENARLEGRISELERSIERYGAERRAVIAR